MQAEEVEQARPHFRTSVDLAVRLRAPLERNQRLDALPVEQFQILQRPVGLSAATCSTLKCGVVSATSTGSVVASPDWPTVASAAVTTFVRHPIIACRFTNARRT